MPRESATLNVCGPRIKKVRLRLGWSQTELALKCQLRGWDISRDTIANIEGRRRLVVDTELQVLCRVLHAEIAELVPPLPRRVRA